MTHKSFNATVVTRLTGVLTRERVIPSSMQATDVWKSTWRQKEIHATNFSVSRNVLSVRGEKDVTIKQSTDAPQTIKARAGGSCYYFPCDLAKARMCKNGMTYGLLWIKISFTRKVIRKMTFTRGCMTFVERECHQHATTGLIIIFFYFSVEDHIHVFLPDGV